MNCEKEFASCENELSLLAETQGKVLQVIKHGETALEELTKYLKP
jgi:hypothetical protein